MFSDRSTNSLNDDAGFEAALAGLTPTQSVQRDRLMFLAGQAAAVPRVSAKRIAKIAGGAVLLVAASLGGVIAGWQLHDTHPASVAVAPSDAARVQSAAAPRANYATEPAPEITLDQKRANTYGAVVAHLPAARVAGAHAVEGDYLGLRRRVLSFGVDSLSWPDGTRRVDGGEGGSLWKLREQLLDPKVSPAARELESGPSSSAGART
jgi:hypothetical protein